MRIKIIETESTISDEDLKPFIGTIWDAKQYSFGLISIDCCGGIMLNFKEYEIIEK